MFDLLKIKRIIFKKVIFVLKKDICYIQVKTFKEKVNQCKELLKKMPGIDQSPEEQQQTLIKYQEELQQKK